MDAQESFSGRRVADRQPMSIEASRWRKYGHDRTYLADADGRRLGWIDNLSGMLWIEVEEARSELEAWLVVNQANAAKEGDATVDLDAVEVVLEPAAVENSASEWQDLSKNKAGKAAREQAELKLAENRDRSKFWTAVARITDAKTDERAWRVGANGEEVIGARLDKLEQHGWHVLHAVPIGNRGSDIDHLLIGPGGVWTINTKNHPRKSVWVSSNQIRVDGQIVPYLRNSRFEADRVRKILAEQLGWEPFVKSALVLMTGTIVPDVTVKKMPEDVLILDRMDIPGIFTRSTRRLEPASIEEIFEIARRSTTWTS